MSPTGLVVAIEWSADTIRSELRQAIAILSHRCLKLSARWASEQLIGLPPSSSHVENPNPASQSATDVELYAKSLLELGEYAHAAAVLSKSNQDVTAMTSPAPNLSSFGIFLRAYAMYLAGERRKEEEMVELR
jgi:anaphase-promoting complex subunit 8